MITKVIKFFKTQFNAGIVNAIAAGLMLAFSGMVVYFVLSGKITHLWQFAAGAGAYAFIQMMLKTINTPKN